MKESNMTVFHKVHKDFDTKLIPCVHCGFPLCSLWLRKRSFLFLLIFISILFPKTSSFGQCYEKNTLFQSGERLYYDACYNLAFIWLHAGLATFSVDEEVKNGKNLYKLTSIGVSHKGYDRFMKVRDTFEVFVDPITIEPFEYKQINNEGSFSAEHYYKFDKVNRKINMRIRRENNPWEVTTIDWQECYVDMLSMIYKARLIDFSKYKENDQIPIYVIVDGEKFELYIRYKGKEIITNRDGKRYRCLKFTPLLVEGTVFNKGEDMTVWITDDKSRVPIIVEAKILIGSVKAIFTGAEGLKYPIEAEIVDDLMIK